MDATETIYFIIDGDGHHQQTEAEARDKIFDLVLNNPAVALKTSKHEMGGGPVVLIEVLEN